MYNSAMSQFRHLENVFRIPVHLPLIRKNDS